MPQDLEREVFGGSDSELSEEEDYLDKEHIHRPSPPPLRDADESSVDSGEDDYKEKRPVKTKKPRKKKEVDESEKRVSKKRKRKVLTQQDLEAMAPEDARKAQLDMAIDQALKSKKASKPKRKKRDAEEENLDRMADEEISRLRDAMIAVAEEDIQSNKLRQPATAKLRMLPTVMDILQKTSLAQSIIDNNLLEGVRRWLEPLPDKSLPALNIQNAFFEVMTKMYIDTNSLKDSGLGRVVLFYTKCKRVTSHIAKIANTLVSTWSRPIIKRSASYRDKPVHMAGEEQPTRNVRNEKLKSIMDRAAAETDGRRARPNAVSIPTSSFGTYDIAPRSGMGASANSSVDNDIERRKRNAERLRALTKNMSSAKSGR